MLLNNILAFRNYVITYETIWTSINSIQTNGHSHLQVFPIDYSACPQLLKRQGPLVASRGM